MLTVILLSALAAAGITGSIATLVRDGYRPISTRSPFDRVRPA